MDFFNHFVQKNIIRTSFLFVPFAILGLSACDDNSTGADKIETGISTSSSATSESSTTKANTAKAFASADFSISGQGGKIGVVYRDFQANHSDFENFSGEAVKKQESLSAKDVYEPVMDLIYNYKTPNGTAMNAFGYGSDWVADALYHQSCGNENTFPQAGAQIGVDGLPMQANPSLPSYLQQVSAGPVLKYGECQDPFDSVNGRHLKRGYTNALENVFGYKCSNGKSNWSNEVVYTPGMVKPHLVFTGNEKDGSIDMIENVVIQKQQEACDNKKFDEWFLDVPSANKRMNRIANVANWNLALGQGYNEDGFFPLDQVDSANRIWLGKRDCDPAIQPDGNCELFAPQSLSIFCPPYDYQYAYSQIDAFGNKTFTLCNDWLDNGGPRAVNPLGDGNSAAWKAAFGNDTLGLQHLRNYHFTMMGYASFRYNAANQDVEPEFFEFAADNDLWVFVDGVLVIDLGGTHMMTPGSVNLKTLAENNHGCHEGEPLATYSNCEGASGETGWADGSVHHLHVFYANRQTIGASFYFQPHLNN